MARIEKNIKFKAISVIITVCLVFISFFLYTPLVHADEEDDWYDTEDSAPEDSSDVASDSDSDIRGFKSFLPCQIRHTGLIRISGLFLYF